MQVVSGAAAFRAGVFFRRWFWANGFVQALCACAFCAGGFAQVVSVQVVQV